MNAIIERMTAEDEAYIEHTEHPQGEPLQLELFPDWGRRGQEKA